MYENEQKEREIIQWRLQCFPDEKHRAFSNLVHVPQVWSFFLCTSSVVYVPQIWPVITSWSSRPNPEDQIRFT